MKKIILAMFILGLAVATVACKNSARSSLNALTEGKSFIDWESDLAEKMQSYDLTDDEKEELEEISEGAELVKEKDYKNQLKLANRLNDLNETVVSRLEKSAKETVEKLNNTDIPYASENDKKQLKEYEEKVADLIKNHDFAKVKEIMENWSELVKTSSEKLSGFDVNIVQFDYTNYPVVRMYVDVRDSSGNAVTALAPNMFYVSEKTVDKGDFQAVTIKNVSRLDEKQALNINMVADTSGSMEGQNLANAKNVMSTFLNTVQFSVGDKVKLTEFNSYIDKTGVFTSDKDALNQKIFSYVATGGTKLYDTLIYAVQDVSGISGAKCVLAFTDGQDEHSYNTVDDVVNVVSAYKIPVYIVRIGDNYTGTDSDLMRITSASGGEFKYFTSFGMDMGNFYTDIYRGIKQYYEIEYEIPNAENYTDKRDVEVYVKSENMGGSSTMETNSGEDFFNTLLGNYLRSYIEDMNNHSYNQLASKVDENVDPSDTTSIKYQMSKQVTGGFANVISETLMSYNITSISVIDENTIRFAANEDYDVILDKQYSLLKDDKLYQVNIALNRNGIIANTESQIRIWEMVNQKPEYILKRGNDGIWRFSQYAVDPGDNATVTIYNAELSY